MNTATKANIPAEINAVGDGEVCSSSELSLVFVSVPEASGKCES